MSTMSHLLRVSSAIGRCALTVAVLLSVSLRLHAQPFTQTPAQPSHTLLTQGGLPGMAVDLTRDGIIRTALREQVAKAAALGRLPVLELSTPWSAHAKGLQESMGDARMREVFAGTYVIRLNVDDWDDAYLSTLGFPDDSSLLVFLPLDSGGRATGARLTAGAWGQDRPEVMAPVLQRFFRAPGRTPPADRDTKPTTAHPGGAPGDAPWMVVDLSLQDMLFTVLRAQGAKAVALGRTPFIEMTAPWCPHCNAVLKEMGDARMLEAFAGTYLIRLNTDDWGEALCKVLDRNFRGIPAFFPIDSTGRQRGPSVSGSDWGADTPEDVAPVLQQFFREHLRP